MKISLYIIIFLFCHTLLFGQTVEQKVKLITKTVSKINKDTATSTAKIHQLPYSSSLKGFYKDGQLKKLVYKTDYPQGYSISEYYFLDNKLIFISEKEDNWEAIKGASAKATPVHALFQHVKTVYEAKYYFSADELIETNISDRRKYGTHGFISRNNNREKYALDYIKELIGELNGAE